MSFLLSSIKGNPALKILKSFSDKDFLEFFETQIFLKGIK
jgi:hypothetical protein